jgi:hypothetical protein
MDVVHRRELAELLRNRDGGAGGAGSNAPISSRVSLQDGGMSIKSFRTNTAEEAQDTQMKYNPEKANELNM